MNEEINFVFDLTNEKMNDSISHLELELIKIRAGRANPRMLDGVMVDYYGSKTPLAQIGNINTPDARTIIVQPWEKDLINEVKNVRIDSNLNGILERRVIKKEIESINDQIAKLVKKIRPEIENDTIYVNEKSQEKALKKFYRIKNRQEKRFDETKLIEINIITN